MRGWRMWRGWQNAAWGIALAVGLVAGLGAAAAQVAWGIGDPVEVSWQGAWYDGRVLDARCDLFKVHYEGWGAEWDEWVEPDRLRRMAPKTPARGWRVGDRPEVRWQGSWYPGEVLVERAGLLKVHYTGWGPEWDEWVEPERLRVPQDR